MNEPKDKYQFPDPSGLIIHVEHVFVPLKTRSIVEGVLQAEEIYQQPSSKIFVEVPAGAAVTPAFVYDAITGKKPPADYKYPPGNRFSIATVTDMISQSRISEILRKSALFEDSTLEAVHECCNSPTPAAAAAEAPLRSSPSMASAGTGERAR